MNLAFAEEAQDVDPNLTVLIQMRGIGAGTLVAVVDQS